MMLEEINKLVLLERKAGNSMTYSIIVNGKPKWQKAN
jgi:hypothetical protein